MSDYTDLYTSSYLLDIFFRWHRNAHKVTVERRIDCLPSQLLTAVPQFRNALLHISRFLSPKTSEIEIKMFCYKYSHFVYLKPFIFPRLIEELKQVRWLPQDDLRTYTLLDFQSALLEKNQTAQVSLHSFLHCRAAILDMVWISHFTILLFLVIYNF